MIDIVNIIGKQWEEIVRWFGIQPIYAQILILVGVIALLALVITLVYYIFKGAAYLVYYLLKGAYNLLNGLGLLIYTALETLYYEITGKPKPGTELNPQSDSPQTDKNPEPIAPVQKNYQQIEPDAIFCTECGSKYTDSMMHTLSNNESVFCIHCGKGFQSNPIEIEF